MAVSARLRSISEHLWLVTTRPGTFGSLLGLRLQRDGGPLRFQRLDESTSEVSVPLPEWAARRDGTLCLGAALALADEVSTYAGTALWDQRKRPGVTITISGQLVGRAQVAHDFHALEPAGLGVGLQHVPRGRAHVERGEILLDPVAEAARLAAARAAAEAAAAGGGGACSGAGAGAVCGTISRRDLF